MKEQEQKNLNTQEQSPQQNQDKTKAQSPKTKVIVWSTAGAAIAALSSVASLTTVFSNQRKVSFLDKVLQSIKIDVKDKETKTKDDIKTIANFVSSNLDTKLYELVVEEVEGEVNKQPLDKDKPYTTFRTKFAIRNKITKAQSNYKIFEFRDIKPPKEKEQLNELGKISENEIDRVNDKVKIEFINFNRGQHLASAVAAKDESGKYKYFNIYLKQDNSDTLQYEIVNVNVETNDNEAEATFSYQLKVKSIEDEKFISDKLSIKFKDFAIPSTQLTEYLNSLQFKYKDAEKTYLQDAIKEGIIEGTPLKNSNYTLEFEKFEKKLDTIQAIVKIVDKNTKETSQTRQIDIIGFFDYKKVVAEAASKITFDYTGKQNTFANSLDKIFLTNTLSSQSHHNNLEVIYTGRELQQEDENDPIKRTNVVVSFQIRDKKTQHLSGARTYTINGFKAYKTKAELDDYITKINQPITIKTNANSIEASTITNLSQLNANLNSTFEIDPGSVEISYPADLVSIKVSFRIKEKNGRPDIFSKQVHTTIDGFKMPQKLVEDLAQKITFDVANKNNIMAYEMWDKFSSIQVSNKDQNIDFEGVPSVKQTDKNKITVTYKVKDKNNNSTVSQEYSKTITGFKTSIQNEDSFLYDVIERNGNKVAVLTGRTKDVFVVPAKIGSYKVVKANTLYANESNFSTSYFVEVEEGVEEIERLIINTYDEKYAQILGVKLPKSIKKIDTLIAGESGDLYYLEMYDNVESVNNLFSSYSNIYTKDAQYKPVKYNLSTGYYLGLKKERWTNFDINSNGYANLKGSFKLKLHSANQNKKLKLREDDVNNKYYLESSDGSKLYKFYDNKETSTEYNDNLGYSWLAKNAFTGNKLTKFTLNASNLNKLDYFMFDFTNKELKVVDLRNHKKDSFNFDMIADANTIDELFLPEFQNNGGQNVMAYTLKNYNAITKLHLPKNVKQISRNIITGKGKLKYINLEELTLLETIGEENRNYAVFAHSFSEIGTLDFTKSTKLKLINRRAFNWISVNLKLPMVERIERFFYYGSVKQEQMNNWINSNNPEDWAKVQLDFYGLITISIKGYTSKPDRWSPYWAGQYWKQNQQGGVSEKGFKILWNQN
ncbi:hypothetical protein NPL7_01695 [Metamycoplasma hyosynoviae]|uniref:hypothetical protein n=2 Tax=Metamycoplasma hyosynoviae TaxID=29559 RepID=UPI0004612D68|nr:hypothetical protein [Metamycoplasma hyosynoviae]KDE41965.1 hypothetical protein NPL7_01695 [Metamycoplasma hyosynoviae]KDE43027.1 hypothetical protein NPL5_03300 [Metamycoplasma hyosynoviae]KDE43762.1 hypothetical protein NPL6_03295 [Metamycoplasma hyosynoviae]KDE44700.1 hypothetical protein NPL4_03645 [Metamycoplasma hyosynoviae]MDD1371869.1 hypothetical protein [Metamycoplasma hyosynoviae]